PVMRTPFFHWLAVGLALAPASGFSREMAKKTAGDWERAIVSVEINRKQYDYSQPWTKRVQTVVKAGIVIGPREILTTADALDDRTLVRVRRGARATGIEFGHQQRRLGGAGDCREQGHRAGLRAVWRPVAGAPFAVHPLDPRRPEEGPLQGPWLF